jgi:hypothetical protein
MRSRYWFRFDVEIRGVDLADAIERALRLFRGRVRTGLRQSNTYLGSYRGSWFALSRAEKPPPDRISLATPTRTLGTGAQNSSEHTLRSSNGRAKVEPRSNGRAKETEAMTKKTSSKKSSKGAKKVAKGAKRVLGVKVPRAAKEPTSATKTRDPRLPAAGTTMTRVYKGKELKVEVREDSFRYEGTDFSSLTALAAHITGAKSINGVLWFGLTKRAEKAPAQETATATS